LNYDNSINTIKVHIDGILKALGTININSFGAINYVNYKNDRTNLRNFRYF